MPIVSQTVLGRTLHVRFGTVREQTDYDDAWLLACALRAEVIFDIGANVGYDALLATLSGRLRQIVLVEANPTALAMAAENLILNGVSGDARFVAAFADEAPDRSMRFWTSGVGAASSMFASHAETASRLDRSIEVPTTSVDALSRRYGVLPDLVKIDVEGAESRVLSGSIDCAAGLKTRFLVEMHSNPELQMPENAERVLRWCADRGYAAWYLKEKVRLEDAWQIETRGRCHLLLQPSSWTFPEWLLPIEQSAELESVANIMEPNGMVDA